MKEIQSIFLLTLTFFCIMLRKHKKLSENPPSGCLNGRLSGLCIERFL